MRKFPMILLGVFLGGQVLGARQVPAPQIVLEQKPVPSSITAFRAESVAFLPSQDHKNSPIGVSRELTSVITDWSDFRRY